MNTRDHKVKENSEDFFLTKYLIMILKKFIGKKKKHQNLR